MKILILEFNNFHEEVIISQLDFLKNTQYDIHLFIHNDLKAKFDFSEYNVKVNYFNKGSKLSRIANLKNVKNYIKKNKIDLILFNTYENRETQILSYFIRQKKLAILHNADRVIEGKINKKIDNFIVLNKTIYETLKKNDPQISVSYFYPLVDYNKNNIDSKNGDKIKIVIPGLIELSRRDYLGLIDLLKYNRLNNIEFILLGNILKNDGPKVYKELEQNKLLDYFKVYKGFVPYEKYFSVIANADLIMPLIHPNVENFNKYHHTKITAAFTMALSFKIPLFLYESFKILEEYRPYSFFYNFDSFAKKLKGLKKEDIASMKNRMLLSKSISYEEQRTKYTNILFQELNNVCR